MHPAIEKQVSLKETTFMSLCILMRQGVNHYADNLLRISDEDFVVLTIMGGPQAQERGKVTVRCPFTVTQAFWYSEKRNGGMP